MSIRYFALILLILSYVYLTSCTTSHSNCYSAYYPEVSLPISSLPVDEIYNARAAYISVKPNGQIFAGLRVLSVNYMGTVMRKMLTEWGLDTPVYIGADSNTDFEYLRKVMVVCFTNGVRRFGFSVVANDGRNFTILRFSMPECSFLQQDSKYLTNGTASYIKIRIEAKGCLVENEFVPYDLLEKRLKEKVVAFKNVSIVLIPCQGLKHRDIIQSLISCRNAGVDKVGLSVLYMDI